MAGKKRRRIKGALDLGQVVVVQTPQSQPTPLYTVPELARHFKVTPRTIRNYMGRGLPFKRTFGRVRFDIAEVAAFFAKGSGGNNQGGQGGGLQGAGKAA